MNIIGSVALTVITGQLSGFVRLWEIVLMGSFYITMLYTNCKDSNEYL